MSVRSSGRLRKAIKEAQKAVGVKSVEVGFFSDARYSDGTPVTNVAAWNEFGTRTRNGQVDIPSRPFYRNSFDELEDNARATLKEAVDPATMVVSPDLAEVIGLQSQEIVKSSIVRLRVPPNAPSTIRAKGSSNPLIDTGFMRNSVTYKVNK